MSGRGIVPAAAAVTLASLLLLGWTRPAPEPVPDAAPRPAPVLEAGLATTGVLPEEQPPRFRMPPRERFAVVVERPLFHPSRRPPAEPTAAPEPPPPPPEPLHAVLRGIVSGDGRRLALLAVEGSPDLLRLSVGQSHDGWRLDAIAKDRVSLSRGEQRAVLHLGYGAGNGG